MKGLNSSQKQSIILYDSQLIFSISRKELFLICPSLQKMHKVMFQKDEHLLWVGYIKKEILSHSAKKNPKCMDLEETMINVC